MKEAIVLPVGENFMSDFALIFAAVSKCISIVSRVNLAELNSLTCHIMTSKDMF